MTRRSRKFENGGFSMKTRRMFSFHTTLEKFKNETILFVIKVNSRDFSGAIVFQNESSKLFSSTRKRKTAQAT